MILMIVKLKEDRINKNGRFIYSDARWNHMVKTGEKIENLGYSVSKNNPNLFCKQIYYNDEKAGFNDEIKGIKFIDLRGADIFPIWGDSSPIIYFQEISFKRYIKEVILLERNKCLPRTTFHQDSELEGWAIDIGIPDGYCKGCGKNILYKVDWDILEDGIFKFKNK